MKQVVLHKKGEKGGIVESEYFAMVDDEDFEPVNAHKWFLMKLYHCETEILYARRYETINGKFTAILMHRYILEVKKREEKVDHVNHNGLDNTRKNIRICTHSQNMSFRTSVKNSSSKYLGVSFNNKNRKWSVSLSHNKTKYYLGSFLSEDEAAFAYNEKALEAKGEYATLNIISQFFI